MHIPNSFGGGFRYHDFVCDKNINKLYDKFADFKKYSLFKENQSKLYSMDKFL